MVSTNECFKGLLSSWHSGLPFSQNFVSVWTGLRLLNCQILRAYGQKDHKIQKNTKNSQNTQMQSILQLNMISSEAI